MLNKDKILDDIARVAGSTVSVVNGLSKQAKEEMKVRFDEMATRLDLVPREDFERLEIMVQALNARIDTLEGKKKPAPKTATPKKAKKTATKKK